MEENNNQHESCSMEDDPTKSCCSGGDCQGCYKIWHIISAIVITALLIGGGVYYWQSSKTPALSPATVVKTNVVKEKTTTATKTTPIITTSDTQKIVAYNCEQSGGTYENNKCTCPSGTYEMNGKQLPKYKYEKDTGYCSDPMGIEGGNIGDMVKKVLELERLKFSIKANTE